MDALLVIISSKFYRKFEGMLGVNATKRKYNRKLQYSHYASLNFYPNKSRIFSNHQQVSQELNTKNKTTLP